MTLVHSLLIAPERGIGGVVDVLIQLRETARMCCAARQDETPVVHVCKAARFADDGEQITEARLYEETLTDGSKVYSVTLV